MPFILNCLILGDDPYDGLFTVKINDDSANVYILKDKIRSQMNPRLDYIPATELDVWQAKFAPEDAKFVTHGQTLRSGRRLKDIFEHDDEYKDNHVHVIVQPRGISLFMIFFGIYLKLF
jgi:hypothetical protein